MTTLSARYVRHPRKTYVCDWCERIITAEYMYLYGMAHDTERPGPMRLHIGCCTSDPKTKAELERVWGEKW